MLKQKIHYIVSPNNRAGKVITKENELYFLKFLKAAVSSSSPLISKGYGFPSTNAKGFISTTAKSRSETYELLIKLFLQMYHQMKPSKTFNTLKIVCQKKNT